MGDGGEQRPPDDRAALERIDQALLGLRHLWHAPNARASAGAVGSDDARRGHVAPAANGGVGTTAGSEPNDGAVGDDAAPGAGPPADGARNVELSTIWVVEALTRAEDGLTITQLAAALDVAQSTSSRLVERAVAAGMVERARSARDGRRVILRPTPAGRALADEARSFRAGYLERLTADWTGAERSAFATLLARFSDAARTSPPSPPDVPAAPARTNAPATPPTDATKGTT